MLSEILITIFTRDLNKLQEELNAYADEKDMWRVERGISNSAGNLCLHLTGNLNHFIGATLGNTGYVRNRDSEFSLKNIPRAQLIADIDKVIAVIKTTVGSLNESDFEKKYPLKLDAERTTGFFLIHLTAHLNYHLGQVNYHRRLLG